jgi:hypothetical protein
MDHTKFLESVYPDDHYTIFEYVDDLATACEDKKDFSDCNDLFNQVELHRCSITVVISFITNFYMLRNHIDGYRWFYHRVEVYLTDVDPDRVGALLKGLEPK